MVIHYVVHPGVVKEILISLIMGEKLLYTLMGKVKTLSLKIDPENLGLLIYSSIL